MRIADKVEELISPVLEEIGIEVVDVFYGKEGSNKVLRIYIDKLDGKIDLDDCAGVSHLLDDILDNADFIEDKYIFEVSSPGVNRVIKKERDFLRFTGSKVDIALYEAFDGNKKLCAVLDGYNDGVLSVIIDGKKTDIPMHKISKVNLHFDF